MKRKLLFSLSKKTARCLSKPICNLILGKTHAQYEEAFS
jgi:hypothetical protein